jgi:hypothetical protein
VATHEATPYVPTLAERRLLDALLDPTNRLKNITEICQAAEVSRALYYDAFDKPEFVEYYLDLCREAVKQAVGPAMRALLKEATRGSYPHLKMLLEMAGMYKETTRQELLGKDGAPLNVGVVILPSVKPDDKHE